MITAKVEGLKEFNRGMARFISGEYLEKPMNMAGTAFRNALAEYPPYNRTPDISGSTAQALKSRPGSRYKRKGRLGGGWNYKIIRSRSSYTIEFYNAVYYADKVVGPTSQANVHKKHWRTTEETMAKAFPAVRKEMDRLVNMEAAKV